MDLQIVHWNRWQAGHETLPARAAISRHVCTEISSDEQQIAIDRILANDMDEVGAAGGEVVGDRMESSAEGVRHVQIWMKIVLAMIVEGHIDRGCIKVRGVYAIHPRLPRH